MPSFGKSSAANLAECHPDLRAIFNEVIKTRDCSVICGHRNEADQNAAVLAGNSKLSFPKSKHNKTPSMAADVVPYPIDWEDSLRFARFAGYVEGVALMLRARGRISHGIRWGGDWDQDGYSSDNSFNDLPHFELV